MTHPIESAKKIDINHTTLTEVFQSLWRKKNRETGKFETISHEPSYYTHVASDFYTKHHEAYDKGGDTSISAIMADFTPEKIRQAIAYARFDYLTEKEMRLDDFLNLRTGTDPRFARDQEDIDKAPTTQARLKLWHDIGRDILNPSIVGFADIMAVAKEVIVAQKGNDLFPDENPRWEGFVREVTKTIRKNQGETTAQTVVEELGQRNLIDKKLSENLMAELLQPIKRSLIRESFIAHSKQRKVGETQL